MIVLRNLASGLIISADGAWDYHHRLSSPLNISAYFFGENGRTMMDHIFNGLRQVSSSIKAEYEDILLCQHTFRFKDPKSLRAFVQCLNDAQSDRVYFPLQSACAFCTKWTLG